MEEKIKKPCPVCQSKHISTNTIMPTGNCYIHCDRCGFTTSTYENIDKAIWVWNQLRPEITEKNKIHTIVSYQSVNHSKSLDNMPNELIEQIIQKTQDKLMSDLSKALLAAAAEGKYILMHPLTFSQHEDFINRKLEVVRKLSYEVLDDAPDSEEDV